MKSEINVIESRSVLPEMFSEEDNNFFDWVLDNHYTLLYFNEQDAITIPPTVDFCSFFN